MTKYTEKSKKKLINPVYW